MVLEYRANWAGPIAGPGVSVFHGRDTAIGTLDGAAQELAERVHDLFATVFANYGVPGMTVTFDSEAVELNTTTGQLEQVIPVDPPDPVLGGGIGTFARASGFRLDWTTPAIVNGRRLRGRTFFVPVVSSIFDADGTLDPGAAAIIGPAASEYFADAGGTAAVNPSVWSRTHGVQADITGFVLPDEDAILSTRRD